MAWYIYALIDPRDRMVRYVGYTKDPAHRLKQHCNTLAPATPKVLWMLDLRAKGLRPDLEVLEQTTLGCQQAESKWIAKFRADGCNLFNVARGSAVSTGMGALKSERCSKGHLLAGENLYMRKGGQRECRLCSLERAEKHRRNVGVPVRRQPDGVQSTPTAGYAPREVARRAASKPGRKYVPLEDA